MTIGSVVPKEFRQSISFYVFGSSKALEDSSCGNCVKTGEIIRAMMDVIFLFLSHSSIPPGDNFFHFFFTQKPLKWKSRVFHKRRETRLEEEDDAGWQFGPGIETEKITSTRKKIYGSFFVRPGKAATQQPLFRRIISPETLVWRVVFGMAEKNSLWEENVPTYLRWTRFPRWRKKNLIRISWWISQDD